ncbi:hypothetical protein [Enterococcus phage vB_EfKS5]|nr:hypothetical protein [Enterococcus phage vB_EfKS5]
MEVLLIHFIKLFIPYNCLIASYTCFNANDMAFNKVVVKA